MFASFCKTSNTTKNKGAFLEPVGFLVAKQQIFCTSLPKKSAREQCLQLSSCAYETSYREPPDKWPVDPNSEMMSTKGSTIKNKARVFVGFPTLDFGEHPPFPTANLGGLA